MSKVVGYRAVDRALKTVASEVKTSLKEINQQASKLMNKGDYAGAEELVQLGRSVTAFQLDLDSLRAKWSTVFTSTESDGDAGEKTAEWEYYVPILQALVSLGGEGSIGQVESTISPLLANILKPGDSEAMAGGRPRWKVMVRRARKHMVQEGFLEEDSGARWCITKQGRRAAQEGSRPRPEGKKTD